MNNEELRTDELIEAVEEDLEVLDNDEEETPVTPLDPPKFAVKTVLNAQIQKEASEAVSPKSAKITSIICYILLAGSVLLVGWQYLQTRDSSMLLMLGVVVLVCAYLIYNQLTMPKRALRRWEEGMIRTYGTAELHLCTECYELNMVQTLQENEENVIIEGYSDLGTLTESEHLFLLKRSRQQYFFLAKDGFTVGTADEFRAFINEKIGGK